MNHTSTTRHLSFMHDRFPLIPITISTFTLLKDGSSLFTLLLLFSFHLLECFSSRGLYPLPLFLIYSSYWVFSIHPLHVSKPLDNTLVYSVTSLFLDTPHRYIFTFLYLLQFNFNLKLRLNIFKIFKYLFNFLYLHSSPPIYSRARFLT